MITRASQQMKATTGRGGRDSATRECLCRDWTVSGEQVLNCDEAATGGKCCSVVTSNTKIQMWVSVAIRGTRSQGSGETCVGESVGQTRTI
ncbi:hypothetical protein E2C01_084914 [Portunus trituberculatus]|uniref:Uncharacterized protein n=1 Tax=Portunus trituberculatus TaxID=210409 RepID=A0A5B7IZJ9_PORTR|nr:hypothetical protein [Portunus trituberculatus]